MSLHIASTFIITQLAVFDSIVKIERGGGIEKKNFSVFFVCPVYDKLKYMYTSLRYSELPINFAFIYQFIIVR